MIKTGSIKKKLIESGLKNNRCEKCDNDMWNGLPIPLELEHINGNSTDHRIENLSLLCPNCHSQTMTYKGKNRGNGRYSRNKKNPW